MQINKKLINKIINTTRITDNGTNYTIRIPHKDGGAINSAIVFNARCCYVVAIGNSNQIWSYSLGSRDTTTMTAAIANHTDFYVDVNLTFNATVWGGISVICLE